MTKVAYLGIQGAYSEQATRKHFGDDVEDISAASTKEIFEAVESAAADYGVLPIENSLAGTVAQSYELLTAHNLQIIGEIIIPIQHALLAPPGTKLEDIKKVRSHPQGLAQCATFIEEHGFERENWYNTAGSAKDLAAQPVPGVAAIASEVNAELYGLDILATNIQDEDHNYTRFLALAPEGTEMPRAEQNKTSLLFRAAHEPGSLVMCLLCFATRGINLTKIESRPTRENPWEYMFYTDFEGHIEDEAVQGALRSLGKLATEIRVLGSYPVAD